MDKRRPNLFRLFCTSFVIILSIIAVDLVKRQLIPVTENIIPKGCFKSGVSSPVLPVSPTSYKPVNFPNSTPQNISDDQIYNGCLCLINSNYPAKGLESDLVSLSQVKNDMYSLENDTLMFNAQAAEKLNQMMSDYNAATGLSNLVISRTTDYPSSVYTEQYDEAVSGCSFDLAVSSSDGNVIPYDGTGTESWITQNCSKYGFVLRFPADKTNTTKVPYSPYHFRYVGDVHAAIMTDGNMCLEEYLESLKMYSITGQPIKYSLNGINYLIFYVKKDYSSEDPDLKFTALPVFSNSEYTISGNNSDGFIVTLINNTP